VCLFSTDIVNRNTKIILTLCQCLRKHFGSIPIRHRGPLDNDRGRFMQPDHLQRLSTSPQIDQGRSESSPGRTTRSPNGSNKLFMSSNSPTNQSTEKYNNRLMGRQESSSVSRINRRPNNNQTPSSLTSITNRPHDHDSGRYMDNPEIPYAGRPQGGRSMYSPIKSPRSPVVDVEDIALLNWVANMTNRTVNSYQRYKSALVLEIGSDLLHMGFT